MIKNKGQLNIKKLSIILLYIAILALSLAMLPVSFIARGGTVDDAIALKSEWANIESTYTANTLITDSMETVYNDFLNDKSGNTLTKYTSTGTGKNGVYNYVITINTPRDLLMFSYAAFGSHYGGGDSLTKLQAFILKANFIVTQNIDYTASKSERVYLEYGSATNTAKLYGTADNTKTYTTNGLYEGYSVQQAGQPAPLVPKMFVPVSNFEGVFNGQNFIIKNLKISSSEIVSAKTQDAMFESVLADGYVHSFGLLESEIIGNASNKKATALVVGSNAGAVEYVYSLGAKITNSSLTTFKAILNNTGTAKGFYSAKTILDGVSLNDFNSAYTNFTALCQDSRYHYDNSTNANTAGTSVLPAIFRRSYLNGTFTYPNLFGLRRDSESGTNIKKVSTVADCLLIFQTIFENNRDHVIKIANNLDFTFVNEYALIPASSAFATSIPNVQLYSGTIDTVNSSLSSNITIKNLRISSFLGYYTGSYQTIYSAMFSSASLVVNNINFLGCSVNNSFPAGFVRTNASINSGLLIAFSQSRLEIKNVGSNTNISLAENSSLGFEVYLGGLLGNQNNNSILNTKRIAVTGSVIGCDGTLDSTQENKPFAVGGIFGQTSSNAQTHDTVYSGATVKGIRPIKRNSDDKSFYSVTGGFAGKSRIYANSVSGIYVDGTITNLNNTDYTSVLTSSAYFHLGGIVGMNDETSTAVGFITSGTSVKFNGTLNVSQLVGRYAEKTNGLIYVGGIAGSSGDGLHGFNVSNVIGNDAKFNLNYSASNDKSYVYIGSVLGYIQDLGYVGKDSLGVTIDRAFNINAPGGNVSVGGLYGFASDKPNIKNVFTSSASKVSLNVAGGSGVCKVNGIGEAGNFNGINYSGEVYGIHNGSGASLYVGGIGYSGNYSNCTILAGAKINSESIDNTNDLIMAGMMSAYSLNGTNSIISGCYNYANLTVPNKGKDVYVAGLAGRAFSLQSSTNYGSITGTTTANSLNVAGVALMGGSINVANPQRVVRFAVNEGAIDIVAGSVETFFKIGGVLLNSESSSTFDGLINKGNINFTGTTSGDKGTAQLILGGILANENGFVNISQSVNIGNITVTNFVNSYIYYDGKKTGTFSSIGGIVGGPSMTSFAITSGVNNNTILNNVVNTGNINVSGSKNTNKFETPLANINDRFLNVGGILGMALTYNNNFVINDCVNSGNITSFARSGGIIGMHANSHGSANFSTFSSCLNYGDIVGQTAGGIFGSIDIPRFSISGMLNYGNINTTSAPASSFAGGIIGSCVARVGDKNYEEPIFINAVNYGNVGKTSGKVVLESGTTVAASSGGIIGAVSNYSMGFDSSRFKKIENIISFDGKDANSNPLIFGNSGTTNLTSMAVDAKNFICVSDATVTSNPGALYYTNTKAAATADKKWVYADDFMWGLDNEVQDSQTLKNAGAMFVWSEKAYKNGSTYHSDKITDANPYCFALTNSKGRIDGVYLGEIDFSYLTSISGNSSSYNFLKQIEYSRDLFSFNKYGKPPILRDRTKVSIGDAFADIGETAYSEKVDGVGALRNWSSSMTVTFDKASTFYKNNIKETSVFTLDGMNVALKPSYLYAEDYAGYFSSHVNIPAWDSVPATTSIFKSDSNLVFQKVMEKTITIYQGDLKVRSDFSTQEDYDRYKRLYTRDYTFKVLFYDQTKSFELITDKEDKAPRLNSLDATGKAEVTTVLDSSVDKTEGSLKEYAFEKTQGASDVTVGWEKGVFTANFLAQGFSRDVLVSPDRVTLKGNGRTIGQYIAPDAEKGIAEVAGGYQVTLESTIVSSETFEYEGIFITVNIYEIKLIVVITDKTILQEIEGGSYRLSYSISSDKEIIERVFTFAKEKTGDVFLRYNASGQYHDGRLATGKTVSSSGSSENVYVSQYFNYYGADSRVKTTINRRTVGYNYILEDSRTRVTNEGVTSDIITFRPITIKLDESDPLINNRGGAFPDFFTAGKSVLENPLYIFDILRGFTGTTYSLEKVTFSKPKIAVVMAKNAKGEYTGEINYVYSFSIFAPNGNEGKYSINLTNTLVNKGTTIMSEGFLTDGVGIVGRGETKNFKLDTSFKTESSIVLDYSMPKAEIYVAMEREGTTLKDEKLIAIYNYNTTETENDDFEIIDPSYVLPKVTVLSTAEGGISVRFSYSSSTSGGIYKIRPFTKYSYDINLPADLELTVTDGVEAPKAVTTFVYPSFNYYELIAEKTASTKRHISTLDFSSPPDSGVIQYYVSKTPIAVDGAVTVDGVTGKAKVNYSMFPSGVDMSRLRMVVKYAAADYDLDYNTDIIFELYGEGYYTGSTAAADYSSSYIDEYARIFIVEDGVLKNELRKEVEYTDSTNTVVKMVRYYMHLPESQAFQLRVLAENPAFYCDYQLLSDGTPRNKTFNVEVNSPSGHKGLFTVSLKTQINGVFTRTTNLLYVVADTPLSSHYYAKLRENGSYYNNYTSTLNMSATYVLSVSSPDNNVKIKIDSIATGSVDDSSRLTVNLANNSFYITGDDPLIVNIKITLEVDSNYKPPWGATGKG